MLLNRGASSAGTTGVRLEGEGKVKGAGRDRQSGNGAGFGKKGQGRSVIKLSGAESLYLEYTQLHPVTSNYRLT